MKYICLLLLGINVCVCAMDFGDDDDFVKKLVKGSVFEKPLGQQPAIEKNPVLLLSMHKVLQDLICSEVPGM